nr:protein kinase [Gemmatimonadales bacterium]
MSDSPDHTSSGVDSLRAALRDRYALEQEIGAGGMARVYLARDLRHRRQVAIKVLRPDLGIPLGGERFLREIEVAAGLQHPHIVPVYDSGAVPDGSALDGSAPWFVMPFIEGESLRDRLRRDGRLEVADALRITREVAGALGYAHSHGVVHRDIKPENILLSGGVALVADFGIARAIESGAGAGSRGRLTQIGFRVGTPEYMSPEQALSGDDVDARTDQYALAAVLFEMLSGEPAFTGPTPQAIMTASITGPRPDPRRDRPELPVELGRVVARGLARDPAERYPDVVAFADAAQASAPSASMGGGPRRAAWLIFAGLTLVVGLAAFLLGRRASGSAVARGAETMAVVPFTSAGQGLELMGEGMVDLLSTNLNAVGGIRTVDPRTVLARWRAHAGKDPAGLDAALAVARDVGAGSVLMGSVVAAGGAVRISAELHSVRGDELARARVDGPADSVLPLVDRLSVAVLRDIWRSREPVPSLQVSSITSSSLDAIRAFLRGEQFYRRGDWDSAIVAYGRATELDSTFALASFRLATAYGWLGGLGAPGYRAASEAGFRHASRLPPRDRQLMNGFQLFSAGNPAAIDSLRRYTADHPEDAQGWYLLGEALFHSWPVTAPTPDSVNAAFNRVLRLDSTLTPALVHPIELALANRDHPAFERYVGLLGTRASADLAELARAGGEVVWGQGITDSLARILYRPPRLLWSVLAAAIRSPTATSDSVMTFAATLERAAPASIGRQLSGTGRTSTVAGMGRLREARLLADSLGSGGSGFGKQLVASLLMSGVLPPTYEREAVDRWERTS